MNVILRAPRSWRIAHSTPRRPRGCNSYKLKFPLLRLGLGKWRPPILRQSCCSKKTTISETCFGNANIRESLAKILNLLLKRISVKPRKENKLHGPHINNKLKELQEKIKNPKRQHFSLHHNYRKATGQA